MKENISAEEKLLRLIRKGKKKEVALKPEALPLSSGPQPEPKYSHRPLWARNFSSLSLQKLISGIFVLSFIYLAISFVYPWFGLKKIALPEVTPEKIAETTPGPRPEVKPYAAYLEGIKSRSIFSNALSAQPQENPVNVASAELVRDINLVGVISGNSPQAIIEDKKTQRTYYVTCGQYIGELQVENILEGKVILSLNGQRFELYL